MTLSRNVYWVGFVLAVSLLMPRVGFGRTLILHPVDGSVLEEQGGLIVGYCDDGNTSEVEVILNKEGHRVELWDGVFDIDLDWAEGENVLEVGDQRITFISDPYAENPRAPAVHPAMLDNCGNCHLLGEEIDFNLRDNSAKLCLRCHRDQTDGIRHGSAPCQGCHNAHVSWIPGLLRFAGNKLCFSCHENRSDGDDTAHGKLWQKLLCTDCHRAHEPQPGDLAEQCRTCHEGKASAAPAHRTVVDSACGTCHAMHGKTGKGLHKAPAAACDSCHPPQEDATHRGLVAACGQCHGIHASKDSQGLGETCRPCHGPVFAKKRMHGPDALGLCETCHPVHNVGNLSPAVFSCTGCHGAEKLRGGHTGTVVGFHTCVLCHMLHESDLEFFLPPEQHTPFRKRRCPDCHDRPLFRSDRKVPQPWGPLCRECHDDLPDRHGPNRNGKCQACHAAHAAAWPSQLRLKPAELCLSCHEQVRAKLATGGKHATRVSCSACHDPHGTTEEHHLRREETSLCTGCHSDPTIDLGGVLKPFVHGPLNMAGCTVCHDPHGSQGAAHLRAEVGELCASCHESYARKQLREGAKSVHRPAGDGKCTGCHEPHAAGNRFLLKGEGNALCTPCHGPDKHTHALKPKIESRFVSVPADWPMDGENFSCAGCHLPHTSDSVRLFVRNRSDLCRACHGET